ncbi:MAG TPA: hypothetical protein VI461_00490 [Chitinophagaceae bacterium]|nr:hypothetical protein [Chitinophagaceae bacterium]
MKNSNDYRQPRNGSPLNISVTVDEASLLQSLVEKLAHRRYDTGYTSEVVPEGWTAIETSSIEAYVSGAMDISTDGQTIALAYTTCFSYTCTKQAGEENTLTWANSLS